MYLAIVWLNLPLSDLVNCLETMESGSVWVTLGLTML